MTKQQPLRELSNFVANNPHLADIIEQNIHTIASLRRTAADHRTMQERLADMITEFSGRISFVYCPPDQSHIGSNQGNLYPSP